MKTIQVSDHIHGCLYLLKGRLKTNSFSEVVQHLISVSPYKEFSHPNLYDIIQRLEIQNGGEIHIKPKPESGKTKTKKHR